MNKYTARGLVLEAAIEGSHVIVVSATHRDAEQAFRELEAAVAFHHFAVDRICRANGRQAIELAGGAKLRTASRHTSRGIEGNETIVCFEYRPDPDEVAGIIASTSAAGRVELVMPT